LLRLCQLEYGLCFDKLECGVDGGSALLV